MPTHVALLRGINVGGRGKVAMADLRRIVTSLGHTDVATYIQSGNVVFTSADGDTAEMAAAIESRIAAELEVRPGVVVLTRAELERTITDNPFPQVLDPKYLHVVFRMVEFTEDEIAAIAAVQAAAQERGSRDQAVVLGRTLYLHTPGGFGRSELATRLTRVKATGNGTARNWATVTKLLEMLGVPPPR